MMALNSDSVELSRPWQELLRELCDAESWVDYETFSRAALFDPQLGYYTRSGKRIGKGADADFYTASSHREVFPDLIASACRHIVRQHEIEVDHFIEIGAEPEQNLWEGVMLPGNVRQTIRLGQEIDIPLRSVVYSNEVFDAQPFQRWLAWEGQWHPLGLKLEHNRLSEGLLVGRLSERHQRVLERLPPVPCCPYHIDLSLAAVELLRSWLDQEWTGLFIAIDYGKTWDQISRETPQGSARAYSKHRQSTALHANPGGQDLTTHVCWDDLEHELRDAGFQSIELQTLSRFLMTHASEAIETIVTASGDLTSTRKGQMLELISPGYFGQRFQVLSAIRK